MRVKPTINISEMVNIKQSFPISSEALLKVLNETAFVKQK